MAPKRHVLSMSSWETYKQTMIAPPTLWSAAKNNDEVELARLLDDGAAIDARDHRGYSPLMLATYAGNAEAFALLLARGADPNSADNAGNTILMGAAFKGHLDFVRRLLDAGADRARRNQAGLDARGFAEMFGRADVAALLDAGDDNQQQPRDSAR
jgi:ankyrin repeat protein